VEIKKKKLIHNNFLWVSEVISAPWEIVGPELGAERHKGLRTPI